MLPALLTWLFARGRHSWCRSAARGDPRPVPTRVGGLDVRLLSLVVLAASHRSGATARATVPDGGWPARGRIELRRRDRTRVTAAIEGLAAPIVLPAGCVVEGESVRVLAPTSRVLRARAFPTTAAAEAGAQADPFAPRAPPAPVSRYEAVPDDIVRCSPARRPALGGRLAASIGGLRHRALMQLDGTSRPAERALARAMLLGDRSRIDSELADLFTRTGTRHWLALSGWHVALMAWLIARPLTRAGAWAFASCLGSVPSKVAVRLCEALLILLVVPLSGAGAPAARAALAAGFAILAPSIRDARASADGWRLGRRIDAISLAAMALTLEAALRPRSLASLGLVLSYAATFGLILAYRGTRERLAGLFPAGARLAPSGRSGYVRAAWWRCPAQRAVDAVVSGMAASVTALVATLPIAWWAFGELAWTAIPASVLSLPLVTAMIGFGWLEVFAGSWVPDGLWIEPGAAWLALLREVDRWPWTPLPLPPRPLAALAFASLAVLGGWTRPSPGPAGRSGLVLLGLVLLPWGTGAARLEVHVLDVGHGTAAVIRAPGEPCRLFDAGSADRPGLAREALGPLLRSLEVGRLEVVLSHLHRDHASALPWLVRRWEPRLWMGPIPDGVHLSRRTPVHDLRRGSLTSSGSRAEGSRSVLLRGACDEGNEGSRALLVEWAGTRALLMGDAEERGLAAILADAELDQPVDLLLAPHHGSDLHGLDELLARTAPARVWISSGRLPALAGELERRGVAWRATALDGPLRIDLARSLQRRQRESPTTR